MFYCKPQTSLKQDDLFGALCCPFLPTWFAHQQMASGFLSLERMKAQEKLESPGQHTELFFLNGSVHSSKAYEDQQ